MKLVNYPRQQIVASLVAAGVNQAKAVEAVYLACQAADKAAAAMFDTAELSRDPAIKLLVLQVCAGLFRTHADTIDGLTRTFASEIGSRTEDVVVQA